MPKPTTHTDVLVPRPSTDDPVSHVHITLTSALADGMIKSQVVKVHNNNAMTVKGTTSIEHATQELLTATADIEATTHVQQGLEMNGSPTQDTPVTHQASTFHFKWTGKNAIGDVVIGISGRLGAETLNARLAVGADGQAGADYNEIWLLTGRGLTAAKMVVEFK